MRLRVDEDAVRKAALEIVRELKLDMKVSDTEWQWDRRRLTCYFTAEERVDFRQLVRQLERRFSTRVHMWHIGVRDEARRLDGVGRCGRQFCSSSWLPELRPVKSSSAKDQRLSTLNPSQISGTCGRLMCCLRYEHEFYVQSRKRFPKEGKIVATSLGEEKIVSNDIFRDTVTLRTAAGEARTIPLVQFRKELGDSAPAIEETPAGPRRRRAEREAAGAIARRRGATPRSPTPHRSRAESRQSRARTPDRRRTRQDGREKRSEAARCRRGRHEHQSLAIGQRGRRAPERHGSPDVADAAADAAAARRGRGGAGRRERPERRRLAARARRAAIGHLTHMARFYLTTAIDYSNGDPHLGHALEKIGADAICRFHRQMGDDVWFLIGMDEHGQKVARTAEEAGLAPAGVRRQDRRRASTSTWKRARASRTTSSSAPPPPTHHEAVAAPARADLRARAPDDFYERSYTGMYCVGCESFKQPADVVDGKCALHPTRTLEEVTERNWFFRLSRVRARAQGAPRRAPGVPRARHPAQRDPRAARPGARGHLGEPLAFRLGRPLPAPALHRRDADHLRLVRRAPQLLDRAVLPGLEGAEWPADACT